MTIPPRTAISYNAQHAPLGAWSSFTIGHFGSRGGFGSQIGRPGDSNVFIGYQQGGARLQLLPFFDGAMAHHREDFTPEEALSVDDDEAFDVLPENRIQRHLKWASDTWETGPLALTLWTPFDALPDPSCATEVALRRACCPAIPVTISLDNRSGTTPLTGVFAVDAPRLRALDSTGTGALTGVACGGQYGMACRPEPGVEPFMEFSVQDGIRHAGSRIFRLGRTGGLVFRVPPGEVRTFQLALGWYNGGIVTTGLETTYWYTRYFRSLEPVLDFSLDHFDVYRSQCEQRDAQLVGSGLNADQQFILAHATRSYHGSTQWLDRAGEPLWVVNEGEYEMMNTLDLTVDQVFFEMRFSPWTVRNELAFYAERYAYRDHLHRPDDTGNPHPGGISFCHDQGVSGQFAPSGQSAYEQAGLAAVCFSFMTCEQLLNWICCAGVYVAGTGDEDFLRRYQSTLSECMESLLNRDDPQPERRNGIMGLDSATTGDSPGAEITTYDSLDASLGQARNNLYLAVKTFAAWVILAHLFQRLGRDGDAAASFRAARRCADTLIGHWDDELGYIPAVFEAGNQSAILPAIEGLVYPLHMGLTDVLDPKGPFGDLIGVLRRHFTAVLRRGCCQFDDGGWKLSSTSDNSWISKIAIAQHVARRVFGIDFGSAGCEHDRIHADWLRIGSAHYACCDQIISGEARGSRYYPRLVTSVLWLSR